MITIFTTPKDFENEFKLIQENAINSWRAISNDIEIIIMGNSYGAKEMSDQVQATFIQNVPSSDDNIPTIPGLFETAEKNANNELLCYVNADIILPDNFLHTIEIIRNLRRKFLAVGHRWDLNIKKKINFYDEKEKKTFWNYAKKNSEKHAPTGIDYFIFRKRTFNNLPNLVIGRFGWDNWLLWYSRRNFMALIDLSANVFAVHQNHSYKFQNFKNSSEVQQSKDGLLNKKLTDKKGLNLLDANYFYNNEKIIKKTSDDYINRNLGKLPSIFPEFSWLLVLYKKIYRKIKKIFDN
tara:strand:+ start:3089 stop:3973 length:885 start_codon:yes stop_codon:yes gene_type:complete